METSLKPSSLFWVWWLSGQPIKAAKLWRSWRPSPLNPGGLFAQINEGKMHFIQEGVLPILDRKKWYSDDNMAGPWNYYTTAIRSQNFACAPLAEATNRGASRISTSTHDNKVPYESKKPHHSGNSWWPEEIQDSISSLAFSYLSDASPRCHTKRGLPRYQELVRDETSLLYIQSQFLLLDYAIVICPCLTFTMLFMNAGILMPQSYI